MTVTELAQELMDTAVEAGANSLMLALVHRAVMAGDDSRAITGALKLLEDRNVDVPSHLQSEVDRWARGLTESERAQLGLPARRHPR
jgi:hypothetical protein